MSFWICGHQEGLPDYWGIETLIDRKARSDSPIVYQEGLPDYWGIETTLRSFGRMSSYLSIRKDYPTTGVLKPFKNRAHKNGCEVLDQEGLPDYWGIETAGSVNNEQIDERIRKDYPTTGVLKPPSTSLTSRWWTLQSGRITRLLGY